MINSSIILVLNQLIIARTKRTANIIQSAPPIIVKSLLVVNAYIVRATVTASVRRAAAKTMNAIIYLFLFLPPSYYKALYTVPQIAAITTPKQNVNRNNAI